MESTRFIPSSEERKKKIMEKVQPRQHFLIVTYPAQGLINPAVHLGTRIARTTGAHVTFSTSVSAHRKMFPDLATPDQEITDGTITYLPFTDGYDEGFERGADDLSHFLSQFGIISPKSFSLVIDKLNSDGRRVDCVIYTFMLPWAADVAHEHGIPSAQYWIQPATVFAIYYHAFHGYDTIIDEGSKDPLMLVKLPGLPPLQIRDLPSFLTPPASSSDEITSVILHTIKGSFLNLDRERSSIKQKPKVLVNTFDELEADALSAVGDIDLITVGPILQTFPNDNAKVTSSFDLFKPDEKAYMQWLDSKPKKSVVYVSFGSLSVLTKQQIEYILLGLKASGCPFLWVVRKDSRYEGFEQEEIGENGMIVEWCSQVRVLSHSSVGCFVTHCGWNSTLESLVCGVPTVGVPQWADQRTNVMLMEKAWGMGVRSKLNEDGLLESEELKKCLNLVLGLGEKGEEIRKKAEFWKEKAAEVVGEGGSSVWNLRAFVDEIEKSHKTI